MRRFFLLLCTIAILARLPKAGADPPKKPNIFDFGKPDSPPTQPAPADAPKSPEDYFKSKGLVKSGFVLILPQEQALHDAAAALRASKSKMAAAAEKLRNADAQIKAVEKQVKEIQAEQHDINLRLAAGQNDNQLIARHNLLIDDLKSALDKLDELAENRQKLLVSRSDYITATLDASQKADAASHAYDDLQADQTLQGFIDQYNVTAKPKVKLGPSASFSDDLALVAKCSADVSSGTIPITLDGGVPNVEVLINGKTTATMVWDSGCTGVCLSAKTAAALGLHPTANDPVVEATIADGSKVKQHLVMVDSIRIGPYTVQNVPCIIAAKGTVGADLLGNEFQHHFQFKLDVNNSTLQLTPLDPQSVVKTPARPAETTTPEPTATAIKPPVMKNPPVHVDAQLPITGDTPEAELAVISRLVDGYCLSQPRDPLPAADQAVTGKVDWTANDGGYSLSNKLVIGNSDKNGHSGAWMKGNPTARPGFCLEGGTLDVCSGELELAGSSNQPCVLIGVHIDCEYTGTVKATNTIFENCIFSKTGGMYWNGGYSSKWSFTNCLIDKCKFKGLDRGDYGIQFNRCAFSNVKFSPRHWGWLKKETPTDDGAAIVSAPWSRITDCDFFQCDLPPSVIWSFVKCNCDKCTTGQKADTFASKTDVSVDIGMASGGDQFVENLDMKTIGSGSGTCVYAAVPYLKRTAATP